MMFVMRNLRPTSWVRAYGTLFPLIRRGNVVDGTSQMITRSSVLAACCRLVHERPFVELPPEGVNGAYSEAFETARDALLQLNMMVRRGIEPDALMYTSLIATMGRARLEWQAYKLFSRMLEGGIRPLPETYVALLDATSPKRSHLRRELQQKIEESLETFPEELAEAELQLQQEKNRLCVQKFEEYMSGLLPPPPPPPIPQEATSASNEGQGGQSSAGVASSNEGEVSGSARPIATMHIRNPTDAWSTAQMMEERRKDSDKRAQGDAIASLHERLNVLHEEELRIFLSAQRQLRHGSKADLIQRVLNCVSERSIQDMLERRRHYFKSVAHILENDLNTLRRDGILAENRTTESSNGEGTDASSAPSGGSSCAAGEMDDSETSGSRSGSVGLCVSAADQTITGEEKESVAPTFLYTPWGILRKPMRYVPREETTRSVDRLQRLSLNMDELRLVRSKASSGDLDELPESLLRRYAYQFSLTWKRRHPLSLLEAVQWHSTTLLPREVNEEGSVQPTPALRRQREDEGVQKTLENYEAFRIISQRTNNLQVVDSKEINLHLKATRREALKKERQAEETLRRERSLLDAATLTASAKTFFPPEEGAASSSHVLGLDGACGDDGAKKVLFPPRSPRDGEQKTREDESGELPPWTIFGGEEEFNITTGHFGDPSIGRYQELSDGRFRILPSREAQSRWTVDRQLLPGALQDALRSAELQQKSYAEAVEKQYQERLQFKRYRKWDAFLRRARERKKPRDRCEDRSGGDGAGEGRRPGPLSAKKRLSLLLRRGRDKAPVSDDVRAKYCKTL